MTNEVTALGPVVQRRLLVRELKTLRHRAGKSQEEVAGSLEWSPSKLIRVEGGLVGISRTDLEALLRCYGVEDRDRLDELASLARGARAKGWWSDFDISDKAYQTYVGYESGASSIKVSQGLLVPGLLQTVDYARGVTPTYTLQGEAEFVVGLREERQKRVFERAPEQHHIIDEAVIRRHVGDAMPGQLRHLIEVSQQPEVTIQIMPFKAGPHVGMKGPFVLLSFDTGLEDVLYMESARRGDLLIASPEGETVSGGGGDPTVDRTGAIPEYLDGFEQMAKMALGPQQSQEFIGQVIDDLRNGL
jgi:transcriptional regulator with XRE-family HTH domain